LKRLALKRAAQAPAGLWAFMKRVRAGLRYFVEFATVLFALSGDLLVS
jgi:hypothetical protein